MKLHDVLKSDNNFYFYTTDDDSVFYFKTKIIIYKIPKKNYIRGIEQKVEPNGLEDVTIHFLHDPTFNFDQIVSENWTKVK